MSARRAISVLIPAVDRRDARWASIESALAQDLPRGQFEVVVAVAASTRADERDGALAALLARCDRVVELDADPDDPANEILFYDVAVRVARGDVLLFGEAHTVLVGDACRRVVAAFDADPTLEAAWAPRINHQTGRLGALVGTHNETHEARSRTRDNFTLGANAAIRRATFERLGGFERRYGRFNEVVLLHRLRARRTRIGRIDGPLAVHHNDMPLRHLLALARTAGAARMRYYADAGTDDERVRHPVFRIAMRPSFAWIGGPLASAGGAIAVALACGLVRRVPALAHRLYPIGLGLADLGGYCAERRRSRLPGRSLPTTSS